MDVSSKSKTLEGQTFRAALFELLLSTMRTKCPRAWRLLQLSPGIRTHMEQA